MKHAALWLLACCLSACLQSPQQASDSNAPQSAIEVKSQVQTLNLPPLGQESIAQASLATDHAQDNTALQQAFAQKQSHVWLEGHGVVKKRLPDDNKGARHQRFLVSVAAEQTLLFAHNIDLAPRVDNLSIGDEVTFKGEYIYNPKGGIMHWTHHDPQGRHSGWIKHQDHTYQ